MTRRKGLIAFTKHHWKLTESLTFTSWSKLGIRSFLFWSVFWASKCRLVVSLVRRAFAYTTSLKGIIPIPFVLLLTCNLSSSSSNELYILWQHQADTSRTFAMNPGQHTVVWIRFNEAAGTRNFSVLSVELVSMFKSRSNLATTDQTSTMTWA